MKGFQVKTLASAVTLALMASAPAVSQANVYKNHTGDETLEYSVSFTGPADVAIQVQSGTVNYEGEAIVLKTTPGTAWQSGNVGIWALSNTSSAPTLNLGKAGVTKDISIDVYDNSGKEDIGVGVWAYGSNGQKGGVVNIEAENLQINANAINSEMYGLYAQNRTSTATGDVATINVNATNTVVNASSLNQEKDAGALVVMSQGVMNINGNLEVKAASAIIARGGSTLNINTQGKNRIVKLNGDINFNYDAATSGTTVDSGVDVRLTNADSYWTGASLVSGNPPEGKDTVSGFKLTLANGATWNVTGDSFVNDPLTMSGGKIIAQDGVQTLKLANVQLSGAGNEIHAPVAIDGTLHFADGAELITDLGTAYTTTADEAGVVTGAEGKLTVDGNGILTINDKFTYTNSGLSAMAGAYKTLELHLNNATLKVAADAESKEVAIPESATVTLNTDTAEVAAGVENLAIAGAVIVKPSTSGSNTATLQNVTLTGANSSFALEGVQTTADTVSVQSGTVKLGVTSEAAAKTATSLKAEKLELGSAAKVLIGNANAQATVTVAELASAADSVIFLDPAWDSAQLADVSDASGLAVTKVNGSIDGSVIAGQNSFAAFGTDLGGARSMINQLTPWGQSAIGAAVVVNAPIIIGSTGKVAADAANKSGDTSSYTAGGITVADNSILVVNQSAVPADGVLIDGDLTFNGNAQLGVVNATEGEFTIANSGDLAASQILTDNDMIESVLAGGKLTNKVNTDKVLGGVSSFGMQALTRRADMMFASSIADRTSFDQQPLQGLNLWVDVAGERYEADSLDNGGSFSADMGYAVFGADVAVNDQIRAGAAIQYADGTLRTDTMDAKNDFSSYGLSVYGSWQPVEWGKLVADVAYVKGKNGLSAATPALDSDVDTSMVSFGVRAQYQTTFGKFSFVPSVGLRVSRLETDSFNIGTIAVEDQSQTLVQLPIALRVNAAPMEAAGWTFGPSFKLAYVPTFGDKEVTVRGADATVIDTAPVQGAFGLRAVKGGVMLDANLLLGGGKGGTSSVGARIGARYTF